MRKDIVSFIAQKHEYIKSELGDKHQKYQKVLYAGFPITVVSKMLMDKKEQFFSDKYNISKSEFDVLIALFCTPGEVTPTALYENMIFSSGGMTKVLKKLEQKSLIKRIPSETDKRSTLVVLTTEGKNFTREAFEAMLDENLKIFDALDDEESAFLERILDKLLHKLTES